MKKILAFLLPIFICFLMFGCSAVNKAIEEAPKLLDSDFALKGGLALLNEFVKNEIYTSEDAKALLERVGYSNEDVAELEKKKEEQAALLEEYDVTYESIMGKKE